MKNSIQVKIGNLSEPRRDFLKKTGSLAIMSMFGVGFFTSCGSDEDANPNNVNNNPPVGGSTGITVSGSTVSIDLGQVTGLNTAGGWLLIISAQLLVVNVGENAFNALTSVCTHSRCDKDWQFASNVFTCTCHGSRFGIDGRVLTGPADRALTRFSTSLNNNILTINKA